MANSKNEKWAYLKLKEICSNITIFLLDKIKLKQKFKERSFMLVRDGL